MEKNCGTIKEYGLEFHLIIEVISFAAESHRFQRRKDEQQSAYICHPLDVMNILRNTGNVTDIIALQAAVLHDVVEDCGVSYEQLCKLFGKDVADIVMECSDDKSLSWQNRKDMQIVHAKNVSARACLVKIGDKISNLTDILIHTPAKWGIERIQKYVLWSKNVVDALRENMQGQTEFCEEFEALSFKFDEVFSQAAQQFQIETEAKIVFV